MKISVIMSAFNSENYITDCINSILNQTYENFEFVIVDDASTDDTCRIIERFANIDNRIRIIKNFDNKGLTYNLNRAIEVSEGDYIARMDADDISLPDRFEKQIAYLNENTNIDICGSWVYLIDKKSHLKFCVKRPCSDKEIKEKIIFENPISHPSVMMRRKVFDTIRYDESFRTMQDYKLWVDSSARQFYNIPEYLLFYRINNQGITKTGRKNASQRLEVGGKIRKEIFDKQGIKLTDEEIQLFTKSMSTFEKFSSVTEAKEAKELIERVFNLIGVCDRSLAYSRWALTCPREIGIKMPIHYAIGLGYRMVEIASMIPKREDYRKGKKWLLN